MVLSQKKHAGLYDRLWRLYMHNKNFHVEMIYFRVLMKPSLWPDRLNLPNSTSGGTRTCAIGPISSKLSTSWASFPELCGKPITMSGAQRHGTVHFGQV
jgi:hypothetical protein